MTLLHNQNRSRRFLMPVVIAVVAVAIGFWSSHRDAQQMQHIKRMLEDICQRSAKGQDISGLVNTDSNDFVRQELLNALTQLCAAAANPDDIHISVTPGDDKTYGNGTATHVAHLRIGNGQEMGLRLRYRSDSRELIFVGFWSSPHSH
jgi:hypothetical protein